ncbi:transcriptional regulator, partial [Escherichia coli]
MPTWVSLGSVDHLALADHQNRTTHV